MIFVKFILFPLINGLTVFLFLWIIKYILFFPRKEVRIGGHRIPFTPGIIRRLHNRYVKSVFRLFFSYFEFASLEDDKESFIYKWEEKVYGKTWDKFEFVEDWRWVPYFLKLKIRELSSQFAYEVARQFFRNFIPHLAEQYAVASKVDSIRSYMEPDVFLSYFNKYVYRKLVWILTGLAVLNGIANMFIFAVTLFF
ncbi:MAG: hypothetical protein CSB55_08420 [Candidatus Cloacimonadota bacterium]|nr:MAG: hypothetical protein CSB55_08420 [Candidatus Cloacimonadota bacterium]